MNKAKIDQRKADLQKLYDQRMADLQALTGALQDCDYWLAELEKSLKEPEKQ